MWNPLLGRADSQSLTLLLPFQICFAICKQGFLPHEKEIFFLFSLSFLLFWSHSYRSKHILSLLEKKKTFPPLSLSPYMHIYVCIYVNICIKYYLIYLGVTFTVVLKEKHFSIERKIQNCYSLCVKLLHIVILQDCSSPLCSGPQYVVHTFIPKGQPECLHYDA